MMTPRDALRDTLKSLILVQRLTDECIKKILLEAVSNFPALYDKEWLTIVRYDWVDEDKVQIMVRYRSALDGYDQNSLTLNIDQICES